MCAFAFACAVSHTLYLISKICVILIISTFLQCGGAVGAQHSITIVHRTMNKRTHENNKPHSPLGIFSYTDLCMHEWSQCDRNIEQHYYYRISLVQFNSCVAATCTHLFYALASNKRMNDQQHQPAPIDTRKVWKIIRCVRIVLDSIACDTHSMCNRIHFNNFCSFHSFFLCDLSI